ncbi:MAG: hypothetical protein JJ864_08485 [Rhizobiaceae bacterium]|nr:hypothetical protein [Rhizobiaceae bacterium]
MTVFDTIHPTLTRILPTSLLALAAVATPAAAKTWVDEACVYLLVSGEEAAPFLFQTTDGRTSVGCRVDQWPTDSAEATMACDNGAAPKMTLISDSEVEFDGIRLYAKGDERIMCD